MKTTPISQPPLLDFEDLDRTASLASLVEAGLTEWDNGPSGHGKESFH